MLVPYKCIYLYTLFQNKIRNGLWSYSTLSKVSWEKVWFSIDTENDFEKNNIFRIFINILDDFLGFISATMSMETENNLPK